MTPVLLAVEAPWWGNGAFSLLGAGIGGLVTYITTTRANLRKEQEERERQRLDRIRDVSTRFIQTISKQSVTSLKVPQHLNPVLSQAIQKLQSGEDLADVASSLQNLTAADPNNPDNTDVVKAITGLQTIKNLFEGITALQPGAAEATALVAEMRLVVPNRLVNLAELIGAVSLLQQVAVSLPGVTQYQTKEFGALMNAFVNGVRKEMGLEPYKATETTVQNMSEKINEMLGDNAE